MESDMKITMFVTCGRGLTTFVTQEIQEKVPGVCNVQPLGEGKLSFTINQTHLSTYGPGNDDDSSPQKDLRFSSQGTLEGGKSSFIGRQKTLDVSVLAPVFQLSLVERLFLLLYCEELSSTTAEDIVETHTSEPSRCGTSSSLERRRITRQNILNECEERLENVIQKTEWMDVALIVKSLRCCQERKTRDSVLCQDPTSCPGSVNRKINKLLQQNKRESSLLSIESSSYFKFKNNTQKEMHRVACRKRNQGEWQRKKLRQGKKFDNDSSIEMENRVQNVSDDLPILSSCSVSNSEQNLSQSLYSVDNEQLVDFSTLREIKRTVNETSEASAKCSLVTVSDKTSEKVLTSGETKDQEESSKMASALCVLVSKSPISSEVGPKNHDSGNNVTFRVSCRVSGKDKAVLTPPWLIQKFKIILGKVKSSWTTNWRDPLLDLYVNITDSHFIVGTVLTRKPLSLRTYIPHLTLRSTICYLLAKLSQVPSGGVVLDPMCGGGTVLLEAATHFEVSHVIGSDLSIKQLEIARCNLRSLKVPVSLLHADAAALPLLSGCVSAVLCDFPFGQKHKVASETEELLRAVLLEARRVLVDGGKVVLLLSKQQFQYLPHLASCVGSASSSSQVQGQMLKLKETHCVSLGETSAVVAVLQKESVCVG